MSLDNACAETKSLQNEAEQIPKSEFSELFSELLSELFTNFQNLEFSEVEFLSGFSIFIAFWGSLVNTASDSLNRIFGFSEPSFWLQ